MRSTLRLALALACALFALLVSSSSVIAKEGAPRGVAARSELADIKPARAASGTDDGGKARRQAERSQLRNDMAALRARTR